MPNDECAVGRDDSLTGRRVLIVDDNADFVSILLLALKLKGCSCNVQTATNGYTALEIARSFQPHLVLLDKTMPGMDGLEVCRRLKDDPSTRDTLVLMMTGLDDQKGKEEAFQSGATSVIGKLVDGDDMIPLLRTYMPECFGADSR